MVSNSSYSRTYDSFFSHLPNFMLPALSDSVLNQSDCDWSISPDLYNVLSQTEVKWGEIGYITYKRTYSRKLPVVVEYEDSLNSKEEFQGTVLRIILACRNQLKAGFTEEEEVRLARYLLEFKGSVAGRFWWQLGTETVQELGLLSLMNCAFVPIDNPIRPFVWAFDCLMLGSGVGFSVENKFVSQLSKPIAGVAIERKDEEEVDLKSYRDRKDPRLETPEGCREILEESRGYPVSADYVVADSRQGWVWLLEKVLTSYFVTGESFSFTVSAVRPKGEPIKGFGGVSSGPEPLCTGIQQISKIICYAAKGNKFLLPINCLDLMNILASIVVSGNVRRSALLAIGDPNDKDYLLAKRWDLKSIPNWRAMSNNSVNASCVEELHPLFWETYQQGEPYGIVNMEAAKRQGRTGDFQYRDERATGSNPCAEQTLEAYETCALAEQFLSRCDSQEEFFDVCCLLYRTVKHALALPCHHLETQEVVHRNMRMGLSVTGVLQASKEQESWLEPTYEKIREFDKQYSDSHGWPISIKLTSVKPSGTLSLLPGVTPGIHPNPAGPYYIRRIRIASDSPLISLCEQHGYDIEYALGFDGSPDQTTKIISFPCSLPETTPVASNYTAKEQLNKVKQIQKEWSDNSVSVTVYYSKEEIPWLKQWLRENLRNDIKAVSFLLQSEHGFQQAPYETISKEDYCKMKEFVLPITQAHFADEDFAIMSDCQGGACPVR